MIKVLIVDDEPLVRIGIKSSIDWEANGFELVGEASNGKQALKLADEVYPDIIITDIKMPVMDGIGLIKEVKKRQPNVIIVVLSCYDDFEYVKEAMKLGAVDYFLKTNLNPDSILKIILQLRSSVDVNRKKAMNESKNKKIIGECISILADNFIKDLISNMVTSERELEEKLSMYNLRNLEEKYVLMLMEIDDFADIKKKYIEKDEKLLKFSIKNLLEELYGRTPEFRMFIDSSDKYIICWPVEEGINIKALEEGLFRVADKVQSIIKDYLNISVSIGISLTHRGIQEVRQAYTESEKALRIKFYRGRGAIINYRDIRSFKFSNNICLWDKGINKQVKLAVQALDEEGACKALECIKSKILNSKVLLDEEFIKKTYINLIEVFNLYLREENFEVEDKDNAYRNVFESENIEDLHRSVCDYFVDSIGKALKISEEKNRTVIDEAVEYINNYYYKDLSLQYVAEKVGLNPSYFSRVFKKETGESFIDYLTRVRIENCKVLLEKGMKVSEAGEKVGYVNYTYFSKLFKKIVGVNPSEYAERDLKNG